MRDFSSDEAIFSQEYFVYCKEKWRTAGEKGPLFGRVDGFQIDPRASLDNYIRNDDRKIVIFRFQG